MKRFAIAFVSLSMLLGSAGVASAQRVKNVEIEAEKLVGELPQPMVDRATGRRPVAHGSLISARADFVREIVKSAEEL